MRHPGAASPVRGALPVRFRRGILLALRGDHVDQEKADPDHDPAFADVRKPVADHFDDLLQNRLPKISEQTGLTMDRIHTALGLMRKLKISPGRDLVDVEVPPIIPDVIVDLDEETGEYVAALSDGLMPTLRTSKRYEQMATRDVREAVENLSSSRIDVDQFAALTRGRDEIDFVRTALAETMSDAYQQISELQRQRDLPDLRTAAFVPAIERVAGNYTALGIFP